VFRRVASGHEDNADRIAVNVILKRALKSAAEPAASAWGENGRPRKGCRFSEEPVTFPRHAYRRRLMGTLTVYAEDDVRKPTSFRAAALR
jgi:hypothetical protein